MLRVQSNPEHRLWHESHVNTVCVRGGTAAVGCDNGQVLTWDLENLGLLDLNMTNCQRNLRRVLYVHGTGQEVIRAEAMR